jgi:hypothetical protein
MKSESFLLIIGFAFANVPKGESHHQKLNGLKDYDEDSNPFGDSDGSIDLYNRKVDENKENARKATENGKVYFPDPLYVDYKSHSFQR